MKLKNFSKKAAFAFILLALVSVSAFAGSHKQIDDFLDSYEKLVVKMEKMDASDMMGYYSLLSDIMDLSEQIEKVEETTDWTLKDTQRYTDLTLRYSAAAQKFTSAASSAYGGYSF